MSQTTMTTSISASTAWILPDKEPDDMEAQVAIRRPGPRGWGPRARRSLARHSPHRHWARRGGSPDTYTEEGRVIKVQPLTAWLWWASYCAVGLAVALGVFT
jgi:hypothetical protein